MNTVYSRTNEISCADGSILSLYYFITECMPPENGFDRVTYAVGVEMYVNCHGAEPVNEKKIIENVFADKYSAIKLLDVLCDGAVTPTTLEDVIYDYIV